MTKKRPASPAVQRARAVLSPRQEPEKPRALDDGLLRALQERVGALDEIPRSARGTIQFEVARDDDEPALFHITFDEDDPQTASGVAPHPDAWIETTEAEIGAFVRREAVAGALHSMGDIGLVSRLFAALGVGGAKDPSKP
jgi:hypothetical protein